MIARKKSFKFLTSRLRQFPVVGLIGARQVGKTTLARLVQKEHSGPTHFFDLEDHRDAARLAEPMLALEPLSGLVIIDEIQRLPQLFEVLRVLSDRSPLPARFLVLGSASPRLLRQSSESLAGRIAYVELSGFDLGEVGPEHVDRLWLRGGFPRSFLAPSEEGSVVWRQEFVRTFLERDVPQLGFRIAATTVRRFWTMLAHHHGQVFSASELGRSLGVADTTIRRYADMLTSAFVIRQLPPWHANLKKRQVRRPKLYVTDSGLLHTLLGVESADALAGHPKSGASFEGFALAEVIRLLGARQEECYFWATHSGAELDLLIVRGNSKRGVEFKRTDSPRATRSMHVAMESLALDRLDVVHAGQHAFPLAENIQAIPVNRLDLLA